MIAFARDIAAGASESEVREWVKFSLSCTAMVVVDAAPSQTYFRACQLRENLAANNDAMARTNLHKHI